MSISSSALASLVIAGTAIGGSTFAVMANNTSSDINSPSISQNIDSDPSTKLPGETTAPLDDAGNPTNITPVAPSSTPTPIPSLPVLPPPTFNGDDEDEDGYEDEDDEDGYDDEDEDDEDDEGDDD
jgi:hypothetical protein